MCIRAFFKKVNNYVYLNIKEKFGFIQNVRTTISRKQHAITNFHHKGCLDLSICIQCYQYAKKQGWLPKL